MEETINYAVYTIGLFVLYGLIRFNLVFYYGALNKLLKNEIKIGKYIESAVKVYIILMGLSSVLILALFDGIMVEIFISFAIVTAFHCIYLTRKFRNNQIELFFIQNADYKVLIVDDEISIHNTYKRAILPENVRIRTALTGSEAIDIVNEESGYFDLIITDERHPNIGGAEMLSIIKSKYPNIPMIVISGYADINNIVKLTHIGVPFYSKPIDIVQIKAIISGILEKNKKNEIEILEKKIIIDWFDKIKDIM